LVTTHGATLARKCASGQSPDGIDDGIEIFVMWMREVCVSATWGIFRRNWINFLYEDEGVVVSGPSCFLTVDVGLASVPQKPVMTNYDSISPETILPSVRIFIRLTQYFQKVSLLHIRNWP
tara:strand:+ start:208186 stop:208548 length:363 start_codon:yes stop_codon:yes gene_type:complete